MLGVKIKFGQQVGFASAKHILHQFLKRFNSGVMRHANPSRNLHGSLSRHFGL
jgi:hypothetical protein